MSARTKAGPSRAASSLPRRRPEVDLLTRVFVYGTLLAGERNHRVIKGARFVATARTKAAFTLYDLGAFPAMVACGGQSVCGEVYAVGEVVLAAMDHLEGHPGFYRRTSIELADGSTAQAYLLRAAQVRGVPVVPSASWRVRAATCPQR